MREFWIAEGAFTTSCVDKIENAHPRIHNIHVIEFAAYETMKSDRQHFWSICIKRAEQVAQLQTQLDIAVKALDKYKQIVWRETMEGPVWAAQDALDDIAKLKDAK